MKMKKLLLLFTLFTGIALNAQYVEQEVIVEDKLTVGTSDLPTGNSIFEVGDTLGGVKFPRFTQTQIDNLSLSNADTALMLYNLTDSVYQFYDGDTWGNMQGGATLYSSNGTLSGARTVNHNGNTLTFSNGKVKFSSTDNGFVPNKGTTAQMNAISTPETDELFLNTDENGLYRYDGANWVALAKGYGVIGVITDADSGVPTYYADLQSAINATYGSGLTSTVTLYSNIEVTSLVTLSDNTNLSTSLTLNLNGYTISNNQADASGVIIIGGSTSNLSVNIVNGTIIRSNATGGNCVEIDNPKKNVSFSNLKVYADGAYVLFADIHDYTLDLGMSYFENTTGGNNIFVTGATGRIRNFIAVNNTGSGITYRQDNGLLAENFVAINNGSGNALWTRNTDILKNFYAYSNSGTCIAINNYVILQDFHAYSETGRVIDGTSSSYLLKDFTLTNGTSNTNAVVWSNGGGTREHINGEIINNGTNYAVFANNGTSMKYVDINQNNSNYCVVTRTGASDSYEYCSLTNDGGAALNDNQQSFSTWRFCTFKSNLDTSSGHAVVLTSSSFVFEHCSFEVLNSGANCVNGGVGDTTTIVNSTFTGATTSINANVTLNTTTDLGNGNFEY